MGNFSAKWEDEDHNRLVELVVEYQLDNDQVEVLSITPVSVTFLDAETKLADRTIQVWTDRGRQMLTSAYRANVSHQQLTREILDQTLAVTG